MIGSGWKYDIFLYVGDDVEGRELCASMMERS
jgi:hypothetical protein